MKNVLLITLYLFFAIMLTLSSLSLIKADNETSSIEAANLAINQAFTGVLAAENVGGNVTELMLKLEKAGVFLAEAKNAQKSGILTNITFNSENARLIAEQVNVDAIILNEKSLVASQNNFWSSLTFSVTGAVVFSIILIFTWRWSKNRFVNRLLSMKPEVVEDTS